MFDVLVVIICMCTVLVIIVVAVVAVVVGGGVWARKRLGIFGFVLKQKCTSPARGARLLEMCVPPKPQTTFQNMFPV